MGLPANRDSENSVSQSTHHDLANSFSPPTNTTEKPRSLSWAQYGAMVLFIFFSTLALQQKVYHYLPSVNLHGINNHYNPPTLLLKNFLSEQLQPRVHDYLMKTSGFWQLAVKFNNFLCYWLFRETTGGVSNSVLVGKGGMLFQPMYLKTFNKEPRVPKRKLLNLVSQLQLLERELHKRNSRLLILIHPNVTSLYPEIVPPRFVSPLRDGRTTAYDFLMPELVSAGLPLVDAHRSLAEKEPGLGLRYFANTGSHLNQLGGCHVANLVIAQLKSQGLSYLTERQCEPFQLRDPLSSERDLLDVLNILAPRLMFRPTPYPTVPEAAALAAPPKDAPEVLMIGTSFLFNLHEQLYRQHLFPRITHLFYFRSKRDNPLHPNFLKFDRSAIDWERLLTNKVIILEDNQAAVGRLGMGFARAALKGLGVELPKRRRVSANNAQPSE